MLDNIRIRNFKSIDDLSIDLGRFNVFIGENGCGKSNILESIAFVAASFSSKWEIEGEFLAARGSRVSDAKLMRSGFDEKNLSKDILIDLQISDNKLSFSFHNDNIPFSKWEYKIHLNDDQEIEASREIAKDLVNLKLPTLDQATLNSLFENNSGTATPQLAPNFLEKLFEVLDINTEKLAAPITEKIISSEQKASIHKFIIFCPENYFLRNFSPEESYLEPLGYRGEGLLRLLKVIKKEKPEQYRDIVENLSLIDWFGSFDIKEDALFGETEFTITDKYLEDGLKSFDIRNANEGFLFLLFYITLFTSDYTPSFFAIDNIDTALNPKLCSKLITILSQLAVKHNKQVIITTHNPSVLDGLDLNNEDERLFVIARNANGNTRARRVEKKAPLAGEQSVKLSEQFLRGYIGGLPKNF
jgi:AAA15 family ATPase/GTPase